MLQLQRVNFPRFKEVFHTSEAKIQLKNRPRELRVQTKTAVSGSEMRKDADLPHSGSEEAHSRQPCPGPPKAGGARVGEPAGEAGRWRSAGRGLSREPLGAVLASVPQNVTCPYLLPAGSWVHKRGRSQRVTWSEAFREQAP